MIDAAALRSIVTAPGIDPRAWISYGTVTAPAGADDPVDMDTVSEVGAPTVSVILNPSGSLVSCRVLSACAGNGEGEWEPFVSGDQVLVAVPEGDERAGCVILGRLNNVNALFPERVAGMDTNENNLSFKRTRTPYAVESAVALVFRQATTGSYITITQNGSIVMRTGDNAIMQMTADVQGFRGANPLNRIEIDANDDAAIVSSLGNVNILSFRQVCITGAGSVPINHATSAEAMIVFMQALFTAIGASNPGPLIGGALAAAMPAILNAAILATPLVSVSPYKGAIATALVNRAPYPAGAPFPNIGAPSVLIG